MIGKPTTEITETPIQTPIQTPTEPTYSSKLKNIQSQIEAIRSRAEKIGTEVQAKVQAKTKAKTKAKSDFDPVTFELPDTWDTTDQRSYEELSVPDKAVSAYRKVRAETNNLEIPKEVPASIQTPDYLTAQTGIQEGWQATAKRLQEMASQEPSNRQQMLEEQYEKWGIPESFELLQSLSSQAISTRKELDALKLQEQEALDQIAGRTGGSLDLMGLQSQRVSNEYSRRKATLASEIASYSAQSQMISGNVTMAKNFALSIVDASTYDSELNYKRLADLYDFQGDFIADLAQNERDFLQAQTDQAEIIYEQEKEERKTIVDWATDNNIAPAFYGVDLGTISLEDATERVNEFLSMQSVQSGEPELLSVSEAKSLGLPYGTTKQEAQHLSIVPTTQTPITGKDAERMEVIDKAIQEKRNKVIDTPFGKISSTKGNLTAQDYQDLLRTWIGMDGSKNDFISAYPPESILSGGEESKVVESSSKLQKLYNGF